MSWYGNWNVSESVLLDDYNTKLLGVVRIRQQRVHPRNCDVRFISIMVNVTTCYGEYSQTDKDTEDVGLSKSMWSFQNTQETVNYQNGNNDNSLDPQTYLVCTTIISGQIRTYDGTGFMMNLGRNLNNTYYIIKLMKQSNWLDRRTRVVFVEFLTYNANQNLFSAVTLIFERTATMKLTVSHSVNILL